MSEDYKQFLTTGAQRLTQAALQKKDENKHAVLGVHHWLLALIENHPTMAESAAANFDSRSVQSQLRERLAKGETGAQLSELTLADKAYAHARQRGKPQAAERDLAVVILQQAGYQLVEPDSPQEQATVTISKQPTPTLDKFGRDLIKLAREGKLNQVVGREEETALVLETLCRRTKRNPVLVGPAGVGKTAIVEGLAQRVVEGKVPAGLVDVRIIALHPSTLLAGVNSPGEFHQRMERVVAEASQSGVILFIDEVHTIMGGIADALKPALSRGEVACIAATTDEEYHRFIEADTALERRFQPIRIQEMTPEQTLLILKNLQVELTKKHSVQIEEGVLLWLIEFGQQYMRNRHFPDKGVDLLEQCFAHAVAQSKTALSMADAQQVAQRMVGMPLGVGERLTALKEGLAQLGILSNEEIERLLNRLHVTLRGLDLRISRPNGVVLAGGAAAANGERLARTIAEFLFGAADRVVEIDCTPLTERWSLSTLLGSPPGYVGYNDNLPLYRLLQTPWAVLYLQGVDKCHPAIQETLAQAFASGELTDARGRSIYLCDTVVLMTADIQEADKHSAIGFRAREQEEDGDSASALAKVLQPALAKQVDVLMIGEQGNRDTLRGWLEQRLLNDLTDRYLKQGLRLQWDGSVVEWLMHHEDKFAQERAWEHWVDQELSPVIIPHLPLTASMQTDPVMIGIEGDRVVVSKAP